jgi:excisionase family DNA binding protein
VKTVPVIERVSVQVALDPYLSLTTLAQYSGLSRRTLRALIDETPDTALPCYRVGKKILVRRSEFDHWIAARRTIGRTSLARAMQALGLCSPRAALARSSPAPNNT